jgi:hypothetical protein
MTGKDIQIAENTPWACNPASETYWSMWAWDIILTHISFGLKTRAPSPW